ncbi:MAG: AAA family ATPase, partial [Candidatus Eremiobacteraeota bacterium]|nr:AAA family ATPase [Candidatus Eremiobacteraeota bacterium]
MNQDASAAYLVAGRVREALAHALVGGDRAAFALLVALFTRGHALIEGVPGTGKTLAVRAFAAALGLRFRRIQFTPDMMPADVIGTTVFNPQTAQFNVRCGPIDAHV